MCCVLSSSCTGSCVAGCADAVGQQRPVSEPGPRLRPAARTGCTVSGERVRDGSLPAGKDSKTKLKLHAHVDHV